MPCSWNSGVFFGLIFVAQICSAYYPAPGSDEYSNSICTSLESPLCTRNGSRDPCFRKATTKAKEECLQHALEAYYGRGFSSLCPNLAFLLTLAVCQEWPWDTLNVTALMNSEYQSVPLPSSIFHRANEACSIANHVQSFSNWNAQEIRTFSLPVIAGLLLVALSGLGSEFTGKDGVSKPVQLFGIFLDEWIHLTLLWFLLLVVVVMLSFSEDFFLLCESDSAFMTQRQLTTVAHAVTHAYSFSRCVSLPSHKQISGSRKAEGRPPSSWYKCALRKGDKPSKKAFLLSALFVFVFPLILLGLFVWEILPGHPIEICSIYYVDYLPAFHTFGKYGLLMCTVAVYSKGPQTKRTLMNIRNFSFVVLMGLNIVLIAVHAPHREGRSHLLTGMQLQRLMFHYLEQVHAVMVCLLGVFEPIRIVVPVQDSVESGRSELAIKI